MRLFTKATRRLPNRILCLRSPPTHNIRTVTSCLHSSSFIPTTSSSNDVPSIQYTGIGKCLPKELRTRAMMRRKGNASTTKRFVYNSPEGGIQRAFPQYTIFGEKICLTLKAAMPTFKRAGGNGIAVKQKGKIFFEFTPFMGNRWQWNDKTAVSLSPEETGLLISQLPHYPVSLVRSEGRNKMGVDGGGTVITSGGDDGEIKKVFTVTPANGVISFEVDYFQKGNGGQVHGFPMKIDVQLGEWEIVKSLLEESIPYLLGWRRMLDIATKDSLSNIDD